MEFKDIFILEVEQQRNCALEELDMMELVSNCRHSWPHVSR